MRTPAPRRGRLLLGFQGWLPSLGPGAQQGEAGRKAQAGCRLATLRAGSEGLSRQRGLFLLGLKEE